MEFWYWGFLVFLALIVAWAKSNWGYIRSKVDSFIGYTISIADRHGVIIIFNLAIIWSAFVVVSGAGVALTSIKWDFTNTGALGDSFGVLSSGMAGIAAYFAFRTYRAAADEARLIARRAAEPSYLNLLERRFDMMDHITRVLPSRGPLIGGTNGEKGQDALDWAANALWPTLSSTSDEEECIAIYKAFVKESVKGLTNYHRFVYHIISFAERQFAEIPSDMPMSKDDPSYSYIQLLRAQLSDSEMQLMAYNAAYGAGNPKLKRYIERYALFNNMSDDDITELALPSIFNVTAFGLLVEDRPLVVLNWK